MTNWKCICGVVNFATDSNCKRCQGGKPTAVFSPPMPEVYEHSAPNGEAASGLLKAFGIVALIGSVIIAFSIMGSSTEATKSYALLFACISLGQGFIVCVLFFAFAILLDNVVALRRNSQHLAAIRTQTMQQPTF